MGYATTPFRDFESFLRIVVGLDEDDIRLILKQYNFVSYKLSLGIYPIKNSAENDYKMGDHEGTLQIEYKDDTMKTKLILTRSGSTFGTLRFDEKSFLYTLLGLISFWDCKPTNAIHVDSPGVYTSDKVLNLITLNKIQFRCDVNEGKIQNGLRQPIMFSFVLDKKPCCKVFCEPETIHFKKNKEICNEYCNLLFRRR